MEFCGTSFCLESEMGGYVSSGGPKTTQEALKLIKIDKGEKAIDIGCGIGGSCAELSSALDIAVEGIDLSKNMIDIATERYAAEQNYRVRFRVADCTGDLDEELGLGQYGLVFSRDTLLHLTADQKMKTFANAYKWLKPGGQLVITDYCCGPRSGWREDFQEYVKKRGYTLHGVADYRKLLEDSGFQVLLAEARTEMWRQYLKEEIGKLINESSRNEFLHVFSQDDLDDLKKGWEKKLEWSEDEMQTWGWFVGVKKVEA